MNNVIQIITFHLKNTSLDCTIIIVDISITYFTRKTMLEFEETHI